MVHEFGGSYFSLLIRKKKWNVFKILHLGDDRKSNLEAIGPPHYRLGGSKGVFMFSWKFFLFEMKTTFACRKLFISSNLKSNYKDNFFKSIFIYPKNQQRGEDRQFQMVFLGKMAVPAIRWQHITDN